MTTLKRETPFKAVLPYEDVKEVEIISFKSLRKLVRKAKQKNAKAMDRLCYLYAPLVKSIYREFTAPNKLDDDAVNIAWENFLLLVNEYKYNTYRCFPGYIKTGLKRRMINEIKKKRNYSAKYFTNETVLENLLVDQEEYEACLNAELIKKLFEQLDEEEKQVILEIYCEKLSLADIAEHMDCSIRTINRIHSKALANLRSLIK